MGTSVKQATEFRQAITRLDATALVVGTMIGSGIFLVSADILRPAVFPTAFSPQPACEWYVAGPGGGSLRSRFG